MFPPLFARLRDTPAVTALIGTNPVRAYPFGGSPAKGTTGYGEPYIVWQSVSGGPDNYINQRPVTDDFTIQVDAYATTASQARNVAQAVRDAVESVAYVVAYREMGKDPDTALYRYSMDIDWIVHRS